MKILSWNINGLRTLKRPLKETLDSFNADIICFQETKVSRSLLEEELAIVEGYSSYYSFPRWQSGYSGVATYCRDSCQPERAEEGLSGLITGQNCHDDSLGFNGNFKEFTSQELMLLDAEGRAVVTSHEVQCNKKVEKLVIINVYCPRADPEKPERADFKLRFYYLLQKRAEKLVQNGFHVIIVGDLNTAHKPIDHCDPGDEVEFSLRPDRLWLSSFLGECSPNEDNNKEHDITFIDTFRHFNKSHTEAFTCWMTSTGARQTNYGTRLDYILCNRNFISHVMSSIILPEIKGSDHCPIAIELRCDPVASRRCPSLCTKYWLEFVGKQQKLSLFLRQPVQVTAQITDFQPVNSYIPKRRANSHSETVSKKKQNVQKISQKSITSFFVPQTSTLQTTIPSKQGILDSVDNSTNSNLNIFTTIDHHYSSKNSASSCYSNPHMLFSHTACVSDDEKSVNIIPSGSSETSMICSHDAESDCNSDGNLSSQSSTKSFSLKCENITKNFLQKSTYCVLEETDEQYQNPSFTLNTTKNNQCQEYHINNQMEKQKQLWKSVLCGPQPPPLCKGHKEPCVLKTVKKQGPNNGRQFFTCAHPEGRAENPEAKCNHFQWVNPPKVKGKR
ncbi:DNA-(apurinic or apyrimidinic site) lyase 2-like [Limulus polyphemus]|uniref:DNA-(apurinic or apyrimidinic site) endonuclease n=1 Tax=Limulus polyphemus TaxID=6850 RepID=A0ABM1B1X9_LIMPO|nr:DNA-(apurinic or apyrimidinic site) lyase 2-like [Limulus polyphemus]